MRVRIIFSLKNKGAAVAFHHQHLLSDVINAAKNDMPHEYKSYRMYTFSGLKGQTKIGKSGLHFYSNKVTLVFSSPSKDFIDEMLKAIFRQKTIEVGKMILEPDCVEVEELPTFEEGMKFICISPLIIQQLESGTEALKDFVSPVDDNFSDLLYDSTMYRMEMSGTYPPDVITGFYKFQVVADQEYLKKVQEGAKKYNRIYTTFSRGKRIELRGYTLPFTLYADAQVQEFVFTCGFGEFTNSGFGMLDIANINPVGRSKPYDFNA